MANVHWAEHAARAAMRAAGFRSRDVPTANGTVHVYEARGRGTGDVVIVHGLGSAAPTFARTMQALRQSCARVLAPELPGHGFSEASRSPSVEHMLDSLIEALDETLDRPAVVYGNSLGGAAALRFALRRPERVRGLVLGSPGGAAMTDEELTGLLNVFRVENGAQARTLAAKLFDTPPWYVPLMGGFIRQNFARPELRALVDAFTASDLLRPDELRALRMPVLLLWGQGDQLLPSQALAWFRTHLPAHAVIEEPRGWGHCPQLERPLELADRLSRFLHASL